MILSLTNSLKRAVVTWLKRLGFVIHRAPSRSNPYGEPYSGPLAALYAGHVESSHFSCPAKQQIIFNCPVQQIVSSNGFGYSRNGWHPFSATLEEFDTTSSEGYSGSVLKRYYNRFQPQNGLEAVVGWDFEFDRLRDFPSYVILPPWNPNTVDEERKGAESWTLQDNAEHGAPHLDISDGCNYHGPVSNEKGVLEWKRLIAVYESIQAYGYDLSQGAVRVNVLRRDGEFRYLAVSGHHRIAAVAALGHSEVPSTLRFNWIIDRSEAEYWPQVRRNVWTKEAAESYFDHLFDFDAREWAGERVLL